ARAGRPRGPPPGRRGMGRPGRRVVGRGGAGAPGARRCRRAAARAQALVRPPSRRRRPAGRLRTQLLRTSETAQPEDEPPSPLEVLSAFGSSPPPEDSAAGGVLAGGGALEASAGTVVEV